MLKDLGVAALKDFIGFLKKNKEFFSLDEKSRHEIFEKYFGGSYPKDFQDYLIKTEADHFMEQMKEALEVFERRTYATPQNQFLSAFAHYISVEFAHKFDELDIAFFFADASYRQQRLLELFPGDSALSEAVREFVFSATYQEITALAQATVANIKEIPTIVVQTPVELDSALRLSIRSYVVEKYPSSFAEFQVNPQIIGGLRVFVGGQVMDHSWLGRIQSLGNLTQLKK